MRIHRRKIAIVLAMAAAVVATVSIARRVQVRGPAPVGSACELLADDAGAISHVVCVVNSARRATLRNADLVTRIVNALPERVHVTILTNDRPAFIVARDPHPGRVDLADLPAESSFTIWPQDPFLVLTQPDGHSLLLASAKFERSDDKLIAEKLAAMLGWPHRASELTFEGGNIVCGSRHAFIGAETIRYNAVGLGTSDDEAVRKFQRELGRKVLVVGPLPQPVAHIDMMLTPLGADRLALADPRWGADLARKELAENPKAVEEFERSCQDYYFGDPRIRSLRDTEGRAIEPPQVVGRTAEAVEASEPVAQELDKIARHLADWGYQVHRVPFLAQKPRPPAASGPDSAPASVPATRAATSQADQDPPPKADYPCLTYNNVLTETVEGRPIVYLPQYGWPAMDAAATKAWEDLGYQVVPVKGLAISAMYGGSVRCCAKVLERK